jgi:hypothetical protein
VVAAAAPWPLLCPPARCLLILDRCDQVAVQKLPKDELAANAEELCQLESRRLGRWLASEDLIECFLRNQKARRHTVADDFYPAVISRQFVNKPIAGPINPAGMKEQVRQFVKQRENLPRLGCSVVHINDRELVIVETEPGIIWLAELVFEDIDSDAQKYLSPFFERCLRVAPGELLFHRYAKVGAHLSRDFLDPVRGTKCQITRD